MSTPNNQRQGERVPMTLRVKFQTSDELLQEYTQNISKGGMFIASENPPERGTLLEVAIHLEVINVDVRARARVAHIVSTAVAASRGVQPGYGLQFIDFYDRDRERLDNYINNLKARMSSSRKIPTLPPDKR